MRHSPLPHLIEAVTGGIEMKGGNEKELETHKLQKQDRICFPAWIIVKDY